ncbi:TonB-dependent receptor [Mangrovibacterium marinum]|uniref:TonB-linked SusC/RagA family outer membrane protein n=1 Tax=Mangrovibacterium marinum TaxID=1639118 RepID=A0A2T5BZN9_9BACT|nr:TonB-dependent receptor [Mangrovibacterium marinum]PTN07724.1 TonB-linked SusC/RagA family outer membrane protein [Mangrovibacterium marinum]
MKKTTFGHAPSKRPWPPRWFVIMKMTFFLILTNIIFATASESYSQVQKLTLNARDITLNEAFSMIRSSSHYKILYKSEDVDLSKKFNLNFNDASIEEVMNYLLTNNSLSYTIREDQVVVHQNATPNVDQQATRAIKGKVVDNGGVPVPGVSVFIKGTTIGTVTDADGNYTINAGRGATLVFSFVGMQSQEIVIADQQVVNITLKDETLGLDEVTVVGYGTQRKVSIVGSVQSIEPEILKVPSSNISTSFAGKLAGVIAFQRTGEPGADGASFYIRGISTFSGATNPLIIVDGVEVSSGDLNSLPPEVIESFSILKDATATALYGTRGANGVMIVTTKSGKDMDKVKVNVRVENSISTPTSVPEFVDGPTFMEMYNEAVIGRSTGDIPYEQSKIDATRQGLNPYLYPNVDWYNELFKDYTMNQSANVSLLGGGKKMDYFMNVSANIDNGILKKFNINSYDNNVKVKRYTFQNNINAYLTPSTRVSLRLNTQLRDYHGPSIGAQDVFALTMEANPVDFPIMWPTEMIPTSFGNDGVLDHIAFGGKSGGRFNDGYRNPFAEMVKGYSDGFQSTVIATLDGEQKLDFVTKGLTFRAMASFKNWSNTTVTRSGGVNQYTASNISENGEGGYDYDFELVGNVQSATLGTSTGTSGDRSLYFQTQFQYDRTFDVHNVSGMLLYTQDEYMVNNPDGLISSLPQRTQGIAGRATYGYDDRYLFEVNFGYNGSENFAKGKRFGFFPSAAVGYVVSNEKFWDPVKDVISWLKLRASWGKVGNDQIGGERFVYLSDIDLSGSGYTTGIDQNYTRSGPVYNRYENRDISWEIGTKLNMGLDLRLFDKINVVADFYKETRDGIFLARQVIPTSFGTDGTNIFGNLGKVENKGFDIAIDVNHKFSNDFSMQFKSTFTYARNKVLEKDEPKFSKYPNLSGVGQPVNTLWGYQAERLFIDEAEIENSPTQQLGGTVLPGDIKYTNITADIDGLDLVNSDDRIPMGHPTVPEIVYGFGPSFQYKKLDFSFYFQGVAHTSFFINGFHPFGTSSIRNVLSFIADDYWSVEDQNVYAAYPRLSKLDHPNNTANSSYWLRNGAFLKLKNLEVGYTHKFMRFYVSGMNLLTFSKFDLWDPEMGGGNGLKYPTQRVFNIGIQMSL